MEAASKSSAIEKSPKANLQLSLTSLNERKDLNLEFNHEQLYEFYQKLDKIQEQLDTFR